MAVQQHNGLRGQNLLPLSGYSSNSCLPYSLQAAHPNRSKFMVLVTLLALGCITMVVIGLHGILGHISGLNSTTGTLLMLGGFFLSYKLISNIVRYNSSVDTEVRFILRDEHERRFARIPSNLVMRDDGRQLNQHWVLHPPSGSELIALLKIAITNSKPRALVVILNKLNGIRARGLNPNAIYSWLERSTLPMVQIMMRYGFRDATKIIPLTIQLANLFRSHQQTEQLALDVLRTALRYAPNSLHINMTHTQGVVLHRSTFIIEMVRRYHAEPNFIKYFQVFIDSGKFNLLETDDLGCSALDYAVVYRSRLIVDSLCNAGCPIQRSKLQELRALLRKIEQCGSTFNFESPDFCSQIQSRYPEDFQSNSYIRAFCRTKGISRVYDDSESSYSNLKQERLMRLDLFLFDIIELDHIKRHLDNIFKITGPATENSRTIICDYLFSSLQDPPAAEVSIESW